MQYTAKYILLRVKSLIFRAEVREYSDWDSSSYSIIRHLFPSLPIITHIIRYRA